MRKPLQRAVVFLTICSMMTLSFIGYGKHILPAEYTAIYPQAATISVPYTANVPARNGNAIQTGGQQPRELDFRLLGVFPVRSAKFTVVKRDYVIAGGDIFGIKLYTKGVLVARTDIVSSAEGDKNPAQQAGLRAGDVITAINGVEVNRKQEVSQAIENSGGTPLAFTVERGGQTLELICTPVMCSTNERYTAGLWIRDSSAGIGTVTFYDKKTNTIGGLGHAITDVDSGEIIPVGSGELVRAKVMGVYKGVDGSPGELCGVFEPERLAALEVNGETGVFGHLLAPPEGDLVPVALRSEVRAGPAQIFMTANGTERETFDIEITRVTLGSTSNQRNMTIRVTDPALIEITGGIVQGMSGSPILQNGMLVGAVTHVFVNSPLEGYAIFAEAMLNTARETAENRETQEP